MMMEIVNERVLTTPIPIIDGKITIEIPEWGVRIIAPVKQVKGRGTADADKLVFLDQKHKLILSLTKKIGWDSYTAKQIKTLVEQELRSINQIVDVNHYNRSISELTRRKLLKMDQGQSPPRYILQQEAIEKAMETGLFGQ